MAATISKKRLVVIYSLYINYLQDAYSGVDTAGFMVYVLPVVLFDGLCFRILCDNALYSDEVGHTKKSIVKHFVFCYI